jgi:hypothetical protein
MAVDPILHYTKLSDRRRLMRHCFIGTRIGLAFKDQWLIDQFLVLMIVVTFYEQLCRELVKSCYSV